MKVCIVGAGISGLATCKYLAHRGFKPVVFEMDRAIGGVWTKTLSSTRLQSSRWDYQFSDFPWPDSVTEICPDNRHVLEYIESYARCFDLLQYVRFGKKVVGVDYVGAGEEEMEAWEMWSGNGGASGGGRRGGWHVTVRSVEDGACEIYVMDFVILCIGRYSGVPNIPEFPKNKGPEVFNGEVIHSMDYSNMSNTAAAHLIKGKHVIVVGFRKSALDIAAECASTNENLTRPEIPCTMVVRTKRWNIPKFMVWGIPLNYVYLNRFSELLFHKPGEGLLFSMLATLLSPLRSLITKLIESHFKKITPMQKHGMVPEYSFFQAVSSCQVCILPENFYDKVEDGSIALKLSKSFEFCKNGIILEGETFPITTDLVIFATGFKGDQKLRDIFVSPHFQNIIIGSPDSTIPLYRECIHPQIPQLAIIGYSENISVLYISEIRARWLTHFIDGGFLLPSKRNMEKNVKDWDKHMKRYSKNNFRGSCVAALHIWYSDLLCKDMGVNPRRKKGFLADWFFPYRPDDYADLEKK